VTLLKRISTRKLLFEVLLAVAHTLGWGFEKTTKVLKGYFILIILPLFTHT